jgi:hypothetical protein
MTCSPHRCQTLLSLAIRLSDCFENWATCDDFFENMK